MSKLANEKAELERDKLQLIAERVAFEREKEEQWAAVRRQRQMLEEEMAETSRLKTELLDAISAYFSKKAEIEGGLIPAPGAPTNASPTPVDDPTFDADEAEHPESPPLKRKRGRPPLTKRKRGRPPLERDHSASNDGDASEDSMSVQEPKKKGRKKVYHKTDYGTRLPLVQLQTDGSMVDAVEFQEKDPQGWQHVIQAIKQHYKAAPFRFRAWVEKKSKDCLYSYLGLQKKTRWSSGLGRNRACKGCQNSDAHCIILSNSGMEMVLLPPPDSP